MKVTVQADFAVIGGSGTLSSDFPLGADDPGVVLLEDQLVFETPYGESPPFRLFTVDEKPVLTCKMHGWGRQIL